MFKHLLVPLDGSRLAEAALPPAAYLARKLGASITLIHLVERNAPQDVHGDHHLGTSKEAEKYLDDVSRQAFTSDIRVDHHVHTVEIDNVARSIVEHAEELAVDLVVMCSHGRGGPRTWLFGGIAQQVIAQGDTPVFLVRARAQPLASGFACRRLIVPLDGQPDHEQSVPAASSLAHACGAEIHLLMAVHTRGTLPGQQAASAMLLPGASAALLDLAEQAGAQYLSRQQAEMQAAGLAVTAEVQRGDPAGLIVTVARRVDADMIVMGTHGKSQMDAFWSGSVTPRVASRSTVPLLLVPVRG